MSSETAISAALKRLAPRLRSEGGPVVGLRRLSGGATQEIWRFSLGHEPNFAVFILRRAPGGDRLSETGIGLDVEARLLRAVGAAGVPVPAVRHILGERDGLGQGFIMDFVEGETLGGRIVKSEALAQARPKLARQCGEILARIHSVDASSFATLDRLAPVDLVEQWGDAYWSSNWPRPVFDLALRWLSGNCPAPPAVPRLVHGDFRNGNLMVGPEGLRAVLDWELAHVGDPMEDLGWLCVNSWRFGRMDKAVGGFGDRDDLFDGYEAAGGARVDCAAVRWWEIFGTLRWGAICAGSAEAFRTVDPTPERAMIARRTSETEIDLLRLMKD